MKQVKFVAVMMLLALIGSIAVASYIVLNREGATFYDGKFYVGVTYCGNSVQEAKELIDKVKNYTNLFILQSGTIRNTNDVEEIGDYAIASKLNFAIYSSKNINYYSSNDQHYNNSNWNIRINMFANAAKERWGEHFIGIYYYDESGGEMLDSDLIELDFVRYQINDNLPTSESKLLKTTEAIIVRDFDNETENMTKYIKFCFDGKIEFAEFPENKNNGSRVITYHTNETITATNEEMLWDASSGLYYLSTTVYTSENITQYPYPILSYKEVLKQNPIQTHDDIAKVFTDLNMESLESINKSQLNENSMIVFTADYALHWWDYQSGYDVILAELGWNNTIAQEIALVRGAANLQNKQWGTILTWKYTHPPFLTNGKEMFEQMKTSYQTGAQYVIIFNYSEDKENPNTLQEEHFQALERFWNDVVQNPKIKHGNIKAEAALILPQNYGWGMRHPNDNIWGIWQPDNTSQQIWNQLQTKLDKHELKLDIIYEDPNYPVTGKYNNIYYWDQK